MVFALGAQKQKLKDIGEFQIEVFGVGRVSRQYLRGNMKRISLLFQSGLIGAALLIPVAASACAVCGIGPGVAGDPTARGFYWGILFLMAMPFAVAGSIGAWLVYRYWLASADRWRRGLGEPLGWTHKEGGR